MSNAVTMPGDIIVQGNVYALNGGLFLGQPSITDAMISAIAAINYTKCLQKYKAHYSQPPTTAVVAATQDIHIVDGASGAVLKLQGAITGTIATGSDRTVNVDLQKSTGGGAFSSVLTGTLLFNSSSTLYQVLSASIATAGLVAGDILRVIVAVAGSAGNQALGLVVEACIQETPQ
jgi:hypothetical protein